MRDKKIVKQYFCKICVFLVKDKTDIFKHNIDKIEREIRAVSLKWANHHNLMNVQQLEYIIAVDVHRHFAKAADQCNVTQATLSMMIKKLEDELGITIFDRSKQPVIPTEAGKNIIIHARDVIRNIALLKESATGSKNEVTGELRIGIIPTLAPYLLPIFVSEFSKKYPDVRLSITERTTSAIIDCLSSDRLDVGILATPLHQPALRERPIFFEKFLVYYGEQSEVNTSKVNVKDLDRGQLWLLEEGHCMRNQALALCGKLQDNYTSKIHYEAGSIESLMNVVDVNGGMTIIPELCAERLSAERRKRCREFAEPIPVREIGVVTYRHFVKEKLLLALVQSILGAVKVHFPDIQRFEEPSLVSLQTLPIQ